MPFVLGPVGGGETPPAALWATGGLRGWIFELVRLLSRWVAERDPLVRLTVRRAEIAIAANRETAERIAKVGAKRVVVISQVALNEADRNSLASATARGLSGVRFAFVGALEHHKGVSLALHAFAETGLPGSEFWVIGSGPQLRRLTALACRLGIENSVKFWGGLSRPEAFGLLRQADVFVFPSQHESGGWACAEAMAAGLPVICLDIGGPAALVTDECGLKVKPANPRATAADLASAMRRLGGSPALRSAMGSQAMARVAQHANWEGKARMFSALYEEIRESARKAVA
jgi:glycosyltransferase involved in cell wall biosynthesis